VDWTDCLSLGEKGRCIYVAPTERQAEVVSDYVRAIIDHSPLLASLVEDRTVSALKLKRQISLEILPANARTVRGVTSVAIILDESCFLSSGDAMTLISD